MLKHFVIFTFEDNFFKEEHFNEYVDAFSRIKEEYPKIKEISIHKNCIDRPANMDLMIEMVLEDESVLSEYLNSPEHIRMGKNIIPMWLTESLLTIIYKNSVHKVFTM